jgi:hypothetical protein
MGCFESYMEFREEVEKIKINQRNRSDPLRKKRRIRRPTSPEGDCP